MISVADIAYALGGAHRPGAGRPGCSQGATLAICDGDRGLIVRSCANEPRHRYGAAGG